MAHHVISPTESLDRLCAAIREGIEDADAGRHEVVSDLGRWFDKLEAEVESAMPTEAPADHKTALRRRQPLR